MKPARPIAAVVLIAGITLIAASGPARAQDAETVFWQTIQASTDGDEFCAYLKDFPDGKFKSLAELRAKKYGGACAGDAAKPAARAPAPSQPKVFEAPKRPAPAAKAPETPAATAESGIACDSPGDIAEKGSFLDKMKYIITGKGPEDCIKAKPEMQAAPAPSKPKVFEAQKRPAAAAARGTPTLKSIQQRLAGLGYDPGPADGQMGPRTRRAGEAFLRDQGKGGSGFNMNLIQELMNAPGVKSRRAANTQAAPLSPADREFAARMKETLDDADIMKRIDMAKMLKKSGFDPDKEAGSGSQQLAAAVARYRRAQSATFPADVNRVIAHLRPAPSRAAQAPAPSQPKVFEAPKKRAGSADALQKNDPLFIVVRDSDGVADYADMVRRGFTIVVPFRRGGGSSISTRNFLKFRSGPKPAISHFQTGPIENRLQRIFESQNKVVVMYKPGSKSAKKLVLPPGTRRIWRDDFAAGNNVASSASASQSTGKPEMRMGLLVVEKYRGYYILRKKDQPSGPHYTEKISNKRKPTLKHASRDAAYEHVRRQIKVASKKRSVVEDDDDEYKPVDNMAPVYEAFAQTLGIIAGTQRQLREMDQAPRTTPQYNRAPSGGGSYGGSRSGSSTVGRGGNNDDLCGSMATLPRHCVQQVAGPGVEHYHVLWYKNTCNMKIQVVTKCKQPLSDWARQPSGVYLQPGEKGRIVHNTHSCPVGDFWTKVCKTHAQ